MAKSFSFFLESHAAERLWILSQQRKREVGEKLTGGRGKIKFIDSRFDIGKVAVFGKGRRKHEIP